MSAENEKATADHEYRQADPVPGSPGGAPALAGRGLPREPEQTEREHREEDGELRPRQRRGCAGCKRRYTTTPARAYERAGDEPQRERRQGIRDRLLHEDRRVGERGDRDGRPRGGERVPLRSDHPCERVRGEDGRRHREDENELRGRPRRGRRREPPDGCEDVGHERRQAIRLAPPSRLAGLGDRAGELGQLELVGEDRRYGTSRGLPGVERRRGRSRRRAAGSRTESGPGSPGGARRSRVSDRSRSGRFDRFARGQLDVAPDQAAGNPRSVCGMQDGVEALLRRCRDRHQYLARRACSRLHEPSRPGSRRR